MYYIYLIMLIIINILQKLIMSHSWKVTDTTLEHICLIPHHYSLSPSLGIKKG